jgi:hypothetical protein
MVTIETIASGNMPSITLACPGSGIAPAESDQDFEFTLVNVVRAISINPLAGYSSPVRDLHA